MTYLLDVNVLIALGDANHALRAAALRFFEKRAVVEGWATCPLTENAFIRIFGGPHYPHGLRSTAEARRVLNSFRAAPGHQFWPDDISLTDTKLLASLPTAGHLTDLYLLALAVKNGGKLATLDASINPVHIKGGASALHIIKT